MITGAQIRAARAMLRWSADKLAEEARLGVATIRRADAADGEPQITSANAHAIRSTLEAAGVIFQSEGQTTSGGPGVRLKSSDISGAGASAATVSRRRPEQNDNQEVEEELDERHEVNE